MRVWTEVLSVHTCIPLHELKRFWYSCPRLVNAGYKNTPSMHHPWKWNVTTSMVGLKNNHIGKNLTQNDEPQGYRWECRRRTYNFHQTKKLSPQQHHHHNNIITINNITGAWFINRYLAKHPPWSLNQHHHQHQHHHHHQHRTLTDQ